MLYKRFIPNDFWHGIKRMGQNIDSGGVSGYYTDLTPKTEPFNGPVSPEGIPLVKNKKGFYLHPVTVCQVALGWHERWLQEQKEVCLANFLKLADWLVDNKVNRPNLGCLWPVPYAVPFHALQAGWISGLVQGQALSVLSRAHLITTDRRYLDCAVDAAISLKIDIVDGGVLRRFGNGWFVFEEYPTEKPNMVLNGFISALWGVFDLANVTRSDSDWDLFSSGVSSLKNLLRRYDTGYWSRYSLYRRVGVSNLASPYYHQEHIVQLEAMSTITQEKLFLNFSRRWADYSKNSLAILRVINMKILSRFTRNITWLSE